jgi:hypothetical protein
MTDAPRPELGACFLRQTPKGRSKLVELGISDPPASWTDLGFAVAADGTVELGGVRLALGRAGRGIVSWAVSGVPTTDAIDGLPTTVIEAQAGMARPADRDAAVNRWPQSGARVHEPRVSGWSRR